MKQAKRRTWRSFLATIIIAAAAAAAAGAQAGALFYVLVPATNSDTASGISSENGYTSAVDAGNTQGEDRVVNGITLYALSGNAESATADNCTLNALAGGLSNGGGKAASIAADGTLGEALSDMTFNVNAADNSQQEIVLDPDSLESGTTYDLRVYICNSSGQDRQVSLSFVGDGQAAVETGWFNEDDARTSAGGFKDANQVYYINYRYTWDGDSTPGITITQRSGSAPFCLYALTNQVVSGGAAAAGDGPAAQQAGAPNEGEGEEAGEEGDEGGGDTGFVTSESDEIGVESDDFYGSESLKNNGRWIDVEKWGRSWQPTNVKEGWCPYTNGSWSECDDCGWTFVSEEPWAWACYHYGRWCKVGTGCGWAWVPGKVWAASWVSWRRGTDDSGCSCIGWAPLPPEAGCEFGVGIGSWVDNTYGLGPDCYTFINIRDFGSDSYWGCGCIYERSRNVTVIIDTFNVTNICHTRWGTWCGGPDFNWCNERIRQSGGKEVTKIHVNRYDDPKKMGGKFSRHEGNKLALHTPHIKNEKNPKHLPKTAEHVGKDKIDKGWANVKDKNQEKKLRDHIAGENKGKSPKTAKATLPAGVQKKLQQHHGHGAALVGASGGGQHPGKHGTGAAAKNLTSGGGATKKLDQHPGGKHRQGGGSTSAGGGGGAGGSDQHPGGKHHKASGGANAAQGVGGNGPGTGGGSGGKRHHPGESVGGKGAKSAQHAGAAGDGNQGQAGLTSGGGGGGGGKHNRKTGQQGKQQHLQQGGAGGGQNAQAGAGGASGGGGGGKHRKGQNKQSQGGQGQTHTSQSQSQGGGGAGAGAGGGSANKHKGHRQQTQQGQQSLRSGAAAGAGGGGAGGGGGGGGGKHHQQQQFKQQQQQQQQQGGGGGGGGGKNRRGRPTPIPR